MGTLLITSAILALATAIFVAFWDAVVDWCINLVLNFPQAFITFIKVSYNVCAYLYRRKKGGWTKQEVEVERIKQSDCPLDVRNALFDNNEVVVKKY